MLKSLLADDTDLAKLDETVRGAMAVAFENGLLQSLTHNAEQGDLRVIRIYPAGMPTEAKTVEVSKVRIAQAKIELGKFLREEVSFAIRERQ